jgi:hypothetical protein
MKFNKILYSGLLYCVFGFGLFVPIAIFIDQLRKKKAEQEE